MVTLRQQLGAAVNVTLGLTATLDSTVAVKLVGALSVIAGSASVIDQPLFDLLLYLVNALAAEAGGAAAQFLGIVSAMLDSRSGVGTNTNAEAITTSITSLSLSILSTSVCGEAATNVSAGSIVLVTSFQSSYANGSANFGSSGGGLQYGAGFGDFGAGTDVLSDDACKKSQVLSQTTAPYVTSVNSTFM